MRYVESLNRALHDMMSQDERVYILGEDVLDPYGGAFAVTKGLSTAFPDRVLTTPISEAGITGFATGMALRGLRPILEIMFGDFLTLAADQIINSASKFPFMYNDQVRVPLVIRTAMGGRRGYGPTHSQTLEALFTGIPGLTIVAPSHFHDPGDLLRQAGKGGKEPVLFIENKLLYPREIALPDANGMVGEFFSQIHDSQGNGYNTVSLMLVRGEKPDVTLIAYGGMAPLAAEAMFDVFMNDEINVETVIPSIIKPFPLQDVLPSVRESGRVIVSEEGVQTSGWGAEVASQIYEAAFDVLIRPIVRIGAKELPIPNSRPLEDQVLPQVEDIKAAIYRLAGG